MILLSEDSLIFQTANGEGVPFSADMISVELIGDLASSLDPDFVRHAAAATFHYFRVELGKDTVTVAEFTDALERILKGFKPTPPDAPVAVPEAAPETNSATPQELNETTVVRIVEADLCRLVSETGQDCELFFFPRLRDELRSHLREQPQMVCFLGLRRCVKILTGARRWCSRCQTLEDQIVEFLRNCMSQEKVGSNCSLVVK